MKRSVGERERESGVDGRSGGKRKTGEKGDISLAGRI